MSKEPNEPKISRDKAVEPNVEAKESKLAAPLPEAQRKTAERWLRSPGQFSG